MSCDHEVHRHEYISEMGRVVRAGVDYISKRCPKCGRGVRLRNNAPEHLKEV